jgi:hypothetical protein
MLAAVGLFALAARPVAGPAPEAMAAPSPLTFDAAKNFAAGSTPFSVAVGDVNGDGKPDLAVANLGDNVSVLLGNGDGAFHAAVNYAAGGGPASVAIGDVNGDGKPDLAVANYSSHNVSVLLGNGDGTFQTAVNYASGGNSPLFVVVGDLDGDGRPDLAVANESSDNVGVLIGKGDGTFKAAVNYAVGAKPASVAMADMNRDGNPDLIVANTGRSQFGSLAVLLGNGDGTFGSAASHATAYGPISVAVGDVNRDGNPDLAVLNYYSHDIRVYFGDGNGTFAFGANYTTGDWPYSVAVGDVNGDGNPDLAVTNRSSDNISVLLGNGDGTFQEKVDFAAGDGPMCVAVGDVNRDGKPDLAVANAGGNVSVIVNATNFEPLGQFTPALGSPFAAGLSPRSVEVGDVNRDGKPDLVVASHGSDSVSVLLGNGDGTFQRAVDYAAGGGPASVAVRDVNRDGKPDLTVANEYTDNVSVLLGNGDGTFQPAVNYAAGDGPRSVAIGYVNGVGKPYLAVANYFSHNVSVLLGNGDGTFQAAVNYAAGDGPASVVVGDVNRDGKPDLAVANPGPPFAGSLSVLLGSDDGIFQAAQVYPTGENPIAVAVGDVSGDGKPDLAVANWSGDNVGVMLGNGDGTFQDAVHFETGSRPLSVALGDVNRDGKPDLAVANSRGLNVGVLLGNGDGTFQAGVDFAVPVPYFVTVGDVNGDGKPDLAVASSLGVSVLLSDAQDLTPPFTTIAASPAANAGGWNDSAVQFTASAVDVASFSGVAETRCVLDPTTAPASFDELPAANCAGLTATSEGLHVFYAASQDNAGNKETPVQSRTVQIDTTSPALAPTVSPDVVLLGGTATVTANATDALSGLASQSCGALDTSTVGSKSVTCTATDNAGNTASASVSYGVVYAFTGFLNPVDNLPVWNVAKAGQAVPFRWHVADAIGNPVTNLVSVTVTAVTYNCALGTTDNQLEDYAAGGSGLQNLGNGDYQFNWATPKAYANSCKTVMFNLGEGAGKEHAALFKFIR